MSLRGGILVGLLALPLASACGCNGKSERPVQAVERQAAPAAVEPAPSAVKPSELFDAQGRLKPSGRRLAWFEIPAGFETVDSRAQHHLFVSRQVSLAQLRAYLSARMLTGRVEELGEGALYHEVMPVSAAAGAMRFDVRVVDVDGGRAVSLTLDELTFLGAPPLSAKEAAAALAKEQGRAE